MGHYLLGSVSNAGKTVRVQNTDINSNTDDQCYTVNFFLSEISKVGYCRL